MFKTKEDFINSYRKLKPEVYMLGKKVESFADDPLFATQINLQWGLYGMANQPELRDMLVKKSPLIGDDINLFSAILEGPEDYINKARIMRRGVRESGGCIGRDATLETLNALWATTYDIDRKYKTEYHQRCKEFVKRVQKGDLYVNLGVTDPKGDRSLGPSEVEDPDMSLRIVDRSKEGIVVRGAKCSTTFGPCAHEMVVLPCRALTEKEKDYAVAFTMRTDTKGVTYIVRPAPGPMQARDMEQPISSKRGSVEALTIFNDVFIPWQQVLLHGEMDFVGPMLTLFGAHHRHSACGCKPGRADTLVGASSLMAEYNGVGKAGHVREKLIDMVVEAEMVFACAIAAGVQGQKHPSGAFIPDFKPIMAGKYFAATHYADGVSKLADIAGGTPCTMPTVAEYENPVTRAYMEKYYKGKAGVSAEDRIRLVKLVEDLTLTRFAGWWLYGGLHGGGSPAAQRVELFRQYDLEESKRSVKRLAGIKEPKPKGK